MGVGRVELGASQPAVAHCSVTIQKGEQGGAPAPRAVVEGGAGGVVSVTAEAPTTVSDEEGGVTPAGEVTQDLLVCHQRAPCRPAAMSRPLPRRPAPGPPGAAPTPAPAAGAERAAHPAGLPAAAVLSLHLLLVLLVEAVDVITGPHHRRQHAAVLPTAVAAGVRRAVAGPGPGTALRAFEVGVGLGGQTDGQLLGAAVQLAGVPHVGQAEDEQDADGRRGAGHHQSQRKLLARFAGVGRGHRLAVVAPAVVDAARVAVAPAAGVVPGTSFGLGEVRLAETDVIGTFLAHHHR